MSCTSVHLNYDLATFSGEIERLDDLATADSTNAIARRDLGVIYVKSGYPGEGLVYLQEANVLDASDHETQFYLGLAHELAGDRDSAISIYEHYTTHPQFSRYRERMRGRYEWLAREKAVAELQTKLQGELSLDLDPSDAIAVFPFTFRGTDERYASIGLGLAELLVLDLLQVSELQLVERARMQALLDEIAFAASPGVDARDAPRSGRLIGAGMLVVGTFNLLPNDELSVETAIVNLRTPDSPVSFQRSDHLDDLFRLEKEIVFAVLDRLGVTPTPVERERIDEVPTANLQAFLAFSRGLESQRSGRLHAAAASFRQASALDPNFLAAVDRTEAVEGLELTKGTGEDALNAVLRGEGLGSLDVVDERIRKIGENINANLVPGQDRRDPLEPFLAPTPIPDPPPPPTNNSSRGNRR